MPPFGESLKCSILCYFTLEDAPLSPNKKLRTTRPHSSKSTTKWGDKACKCFPRDTRTMQPIRFVSDDVTRGQGEDPVSRAMVGDDEFWRKLLSVNPSNVANKTLIAPTSSCTSQDFSTVYRIYYRHNKEHQKTTVQRSAMHSDAVSVLEGGGGGGGGGKWEGNVPSEMLRKWLSNDLRDCLCGFRVNSQGFEIYWFSAKSLGYSPWIWTWRILVSPRNRSNLSETPPKPF